VLDELGLAEALRAECERLGRSHGLRTSVEIGAISPEIDKEAALGLFRVAQEALSNVIRHAEVGAARIALREVDGGIALVVHDDGAGFDPEPRGTKKSLGLLSMRERVRLLGGNLEIESAPGRGTSIVVWIPARRGSR
jgi:signal transduction histidine kinase